MIKTEKLQQQLEDLRNQIIREKKTNEILKKRAFVAIVKSRPGQSRDVEGEGEGLPHSDTDQSSHVKSTFLDDVSHEIRSSMNGVVGMTNLVLET